MTKQLLKIFLFIYFCFLLSSCTTTSTYAPVSDVGNEPIPHSGAYHVRKGDTLYSIAWRYGLDYRYLAARNKIASPYSIHVTQKIYLRGKTRTLIKEPALVSRQPIAGWHWPAQGRVMRTFSELNPGINISGMRGSPIFAAAAGDVVYSGSGLRGYGRLIIIKHNSEYLTAYAHNDVVWVREGNHVKAGQKIAAMGSTGSRQVMLHFEIRRNGKSVDPLIYLSQ